MREQGLRGVRKGRLVPRTTDGAHHRSLAPNVLQRRFGVDTAVQGWASDVTYAATREGWLYLAVIIALQTRQLLGYSLSDRMPDELVLNALRNAISKRRHPARCFTPTAAVSTQAMIFATLSAHSVWWPA